MTLIIMLSVSIPSDIYTERHIKVRNPECHYAECRGAASATLGDENK
jgi:hypothetical protein